MLKDLILEQSYWFGTKKVKKTWQYKRDKFFDLAKKLNLKNKIIGLLGPRQTGKTTIFLQLINHLIKNKKIAPNRILYISFDHPLLKTDKYNLDQIFETFQEEFLKHTFRDSKNSVYIFLDEVQKIKNWHDYLKHWIDLKLNLHFFISGSSGIQIIRDSGESLLGRFDINFLLPLSYSEIGKSTANKKIFQKLNINLAKTGFQKLKNLYQKLNIYSKKYNIILATYLEKGGYPEVYNLKSNQEIKKLLLTLKSLSIHRDIIELEQVRDAKSLENVLTILAGQNTNRINYENIANKLGIKLDTVKKYISYLESAFLVKEAYVLKDKFIQIASKQKKIYFLDTGLKNAIWLKKEKSDLFENIIFIEVLRKKLETEIHAQMFYGLIKKQHEVDVIWQNNSSILPIEVKYKNKIEKSDLDSLLKYLISAKIKRGILINKSEFRLEKIDKKEIFIIPYWLFLLIK